MQKNNNNNPKKKAKESEMQLCKGLIVDTYED